MLRFEIMKTDRKREAVAYSPTGLRRCSQPKAAVLSDVWTADSVLLGRNSMIITYV